MSRKKNRNNLFDDYDSIISHLNRIVWNSFNFELLDIIYLSFFKIYEKKRLFNKIVIMGFIFEC